MKIFTCNIPQEPQNFLGEFLTILDNNLFLYRVRTKVLEKLANESDCGCLLIPRKIYKLLWGFLQ